MSDAGKQSCNINGERTVWQMGNISMPSYTGAAT